MSVPADIDQLIRHKAATEWPGDYSMQAHTVKSQQDAYRQMVRYETTLDQTNEVISGCLDKSRSEWPDDFAMQVHTFDKQISAAGRFFNFKDASIPDDILEQIKVRAFAEWPGDYEMMLHELEGQIASWRDLN